MDLGKKLKRELIAIVVAQSAEINALRERLEAREKVVEPATRGNVRNTQRTVCEFDPDVPGSFATAMARARQCGGVVRRAGS